MTKVARGLLIYGIVLLVERVLAFLLVDIDAAGQLLAAGEHTPLALLAGLCFFVALRLVVILALPVAAVAAGFEIAHRMRPFMGPSKPRPR